MMTAKERTSLGVRSVFLRHVEKHKICSGKRHAPTAL